MPGVVRETDVTAGHCFTPTPPAAWSSNVTCNKLGVVRNGDPIVPHCCIIPCHGGNYVAGHNVSANGQSIIIKGDKVSCGDTTSACSTNVTACG